MTCPKSHGSQVTHSTGVCMHESHGPMLSIPALPLWLSDKGVTASGATVTSCLMELEQFRRLPRPSLTMFPDSEGLRPKPQRKSGHKSGALSARATLICRSCSASHIC